MTFACSGVTYTFDVVTRGLEVNTSPLRNTTQEASDGSVVGSPPAKYVNFITMTLRINSNSKLSDLRSFVTSTAGIFGNIVTFTPEAAESGLDLGAGSGNAITGRFWDEMSVPIATLGLYYVDVTIRREVS